MSKSRRNRILPHGRVVIEGVKDPATIAVLRQFNDNIVAIAKLLSSLTAKTSEQKIAT